MYYFRFSGTSFDDREEWLKPDLPFIGSLKDALAEAEARCGEWEKELWKKDDIPDGVIAIGTRKGHPKQFVKYPDESDIDELIREYESGESCEYAYDDDDTDGYKSDDFSEYDCPEDEFPECVSYDEINGQISEYEPDEYNFPEYFFSR